MGLHIRYVWIPRNSSPGYDFSGVLPDDQRHHTFGQNLEPGAAAGTSRTFCALMFHAFVFDDVSAWHNATEHQGSIAIPLLSKVS